MNQQQAKQKPVLPTDQGTLKPQSAKTKIEVVYGSTAGHFDVPAGATLRDVLADTALREEIGYGNTKDATLVFVESKAGEDAHKQVNLDTPIQEGMTYEIIRPAGEKA